MWFTVLCILVLLAALLLFGPHLFGYSGFKSTPCPPGLDDDPPPVKGTVDGFTVNIVQFKSHGTRCHGDLYLPTTLLSPSGRPPKEGHPCVIMGHGIGATRDMGLWRFARAFAKKRLAVFVFDYRTFGTSEGSPRHWISPKRHIEGPL